MKYFFTVFIFASINLFFFSSVSESQNYNWITPGKNYLKLYVIENGIHRIDKNDFQNAGVNTTSLDPRTIKIIHKGIQIPVFVSGEDDGIFDENDYLEFYAERNFGGLITTYDHNVNPVYTNFEYFNGLSDTNIYWVEWGGEPGLRFTSYNFSSGLKYSQNYFLKTLHVEKDLIYSQGEQITTGDFRFFTTEKFLGQGWYWRILNNNQILTDTVSTPDLVAAGNTASIRIYAYPRNQSLTYFNEHRIIVTINNTLIDTIRSDNLNRIDKTLNFPATILTSTGVNNVSIKYNSVTGFTGSTYIDHYEITYPRSFSFRNNHLSFLSTSEDTNTVEYSISSFNQSSSTSIYDISNGFRISNPIFSNDTLFFYGKKNSSFEINSQQILRKPFRIKLKQVPDLLSNDNGIDYLVVYNKNFESQAEQLRFHRESYDGLRTFKAEIEDIYDVFNFGIEDPVAIKNFIRNIYENWTLPKIKYICLLGRSSLDPKKILSTSSFYKNHIPTYGNPPTDGYFGNMNSTKGNYIQEISVGRIPAYTTDEAQVMIDKIINYDLQSPQPWWKTFIMISGGSSFSEQTQFKNKSIHIINSYLSPSPVSGDVHRIFRGDTSGLVTYNYRDSIKNDINNGGMIVNFIGHAGSQNWEVGMEDPNTLNNGDKLPFVFSMTCFTGRNSEPSYRGFGEKFLYLQNKGAIGFVSTTGWSFSGSGNDFNEYLFKGFKENSLRRLGDIYRYASLKMSGDSGSFTVKHTFNCYNLIGDPASKLKFPTHPEFNIDHNSYKLSNNFPVTGDRIKLSLYPSNFGVNADSCLIRLNIFRDNVFRKSIDTVIYNFGFVDTVNFNYRIDSNGAYNLKAVIDPDNWFPEDMTENNSIEISFITKNIAFIPLSPIKNVVENSQTINLKGLNPAVDKNSNVRLIALIDTSINFNSPLVQTFFKDNPTGLSTEFQFSLPVISNNTTYYWKTNSIINDDSTGWSEIMNFVYEEGATSFFRTNSDNEVIIKKTYPFHFANDDFNNTAFINDSLISLSPYVGNLLVRSFNDNEFEASFFLINNKQIFIDNRQNTGLNIVKVNKATGSILSFKNFRMTSVQSSDSIVNHLNTFDSTHILMLCKSQGVSGGTFLQANAKNKLKSMGSIYCDSVGTFGWWDTWSLISYPSNNKFITDENFFKFPGGGAPPNGCLNNQCPSQSLMDVTFYRTIGSVSSILGPAATWNNFLWSHNIFSNSSVSFDIYGIKKDGSKDLLFINGINPSVNLNSINSFIYPEIESVANFNLNDSLGILPPELNSIQVSYSAPAEIVVDNNSFILSDSIINEGDSLNVKVNFGNIGFTVPEEMVTAWFVSSPNGKRLIRADTLKQTFQKDSVFTSEITFTTKGIRCCEKTTDTALIYFETYLSSQNEFYYFNNTGIAKFVVIGDSVPPMVNVTYDGREIINGDYVQSRPDIELKIFENNTIRIQDTSNVKVLHGLNYIPYYLNGSPNPHLSFISVDNLELQAIVRYTPELEEGEHKLTYVALDNFGNFSDTIVHFVNVSNKLSIYDIYNYPNPMREETNFIFMLGGSQRPFNTKIKIYTVAGRMIKELNYPASIGHNQIYWDGRDADGDRVSNGVYLYKIITEGESNTETAIQKIAILR